MKLFGRIVVILAVALAVCGTAWGAMQLTSAGETGGGFPAGAPALSDGQTLPALPDGDFAGREGGPRGREGGDLLALTEVGGGFVKVAAIVLAVVVIQRLFARRPRRPAAV